MRIGIISLNSNVVLCTAALDLERALQLYKEYYNKARPPQGTDGVLPDVQYGKMVDGSPISTPVAGGIIAAVYFSCRGQPEL